MLISVGSDVYRLLADPVRARIVEVLATGPACVCHLVDDLGATQPNVSNHVRVLRQAGIIEGEPRGRYTFYRLVPDGLEAAAAGLNQLADLARTTRSDYRECP